MRRLGRVAAASTALVLIALAAGARPPEITPRELAVRLASDDPPLVVDVRRDDEWQAGHIPGAIHIPFAQFPQRRAEVPMDRDIGVHCAIAPRARKSEKMLIAIGHQRVFHPTGGCEAWGNDGPQVGGRFAWHERSMFSRSERALGVVCSWGRMSASPGALSSSAPITPWVCRRLPASSRKSMR